MKVALTFDAEMPGQLHGSLEAPWRILDILESRRIRATFFLQGRWAKANPDIAWRIADDGHLIGNHSHYHAPMTCLTADGMKEDVCRAAEEIAFTTHQDPVPLFRAPFGRMDGDVAAVLGELGYRHVHWDVHAADWEAVTPVDAIVGAVTGGVFGGSTVMLHTWPETTVVALPRILDELADLVDFVTVNDL